MGKRVPARELANPKKSRRSVSAHEVCGWKADEEYQKAFEGKTKDEVLPVSGHFGQKKGLYRGKNCERTSVKKIEHRGTYCRRPKNHSGGGVPSALDKKRRLNQRKGGKRVVVKSKRQGTDNHVSDGLTSWGKRENRQRGVQEGMGNHVRSGGGKVHARGVRKENLRKRGGRLHMKFFVRFPSLGRSLCKGVRGTFREASAALQGPTNNLPIFKLRHRDAKEARG